MFEKESKPTGYGATFVVSGELYIIEVHFQSHRCILVG